MRHKNITLVLSIILLSTTTARLSVAAPLHNEPAIEQSTHPFLLIGDANGGDGGNGGSGANSPGGDGGDGGNNSGSGNGNGSGNDNGTGNGSDDSDGGDGGA